MCPWGDYIDELAPSVKWARESMKVLLNLLTLIAVRLSLLLSLFLLELHGPMMHHSAGKLVDANFLLSGETQNIYCSLTG